MDHRELKVHQEQKYKYIHVSYFPGLLVVKFLFSNLSLLLMCFWLVFAVCVFAFCLHVHELKLSLDYRLKVAKKWLKDAKSCWCLYWHFFHVCLVQGNSNSAGTAGYCCSWFNASLHTKTKEKEPRQCQQRAKRQSMFPILKNTEADLQFRIQCRNPAAQR